jgi:hypothetical protein
VSRARSRAEVPHLSHLMRVRDISPTTPLSAYGAVELALGLAPTEQDAAERLGLEPAELVAYADDLWGLRYEDERDRRLPPWWVTGSCYVSIHGA